MPFYALEYMGYKDKAKKKKVQAGPNSWQSGFGVSAVVAKGFNDANNEAKK